MGQLHNYLGRMLHVIPGVTVHAGDWQKALTDYGSLLAAGAAGCTPLVQKLYRRLKDTWLGVVLLVALFWLCVWRVELEGHNPFKYLDF